MTQGPISFANVQASGLEELGGAPVLALNVVVQGETVRRRPGMSSLGVETESGYPITALHATVDGEVYGVQFRDPKNHIVRISGTGAIVSLSGVDQGDLRGSERPTIAETEALLVFAAGKEPQKLVLSTDASSKLAGSPPQASHVIAHASRLLLNDVDERAQFWYSGVAAGSSFTGHETWVQGSPPDYEPTDSGAVGSTGVKRAGARPDPIVAIGESTSEVFVWGTRSLQTWAADATDIYVVVSSKEIGCAAPGTIIRTDESFMWLDHLRRIVISDGRAATVISDPIQSVLNAMETVEGAFGFRIVEGWVDVAVWVFPDGRAFSFQKGAGWGQWGSGPIGRSALDVTAHTLNGDVNLIGNSNGVVGKMTVRAETDFGEAIHGEVITGFIDRGTTRTKQCKSVRLILRRGGSHSTEEAYGFLSWRDSLGAWEPEVKVSLGASGDAEIAVRLYSLGWPYRRRQWKFIFAGEASLVLASALEEFEVLED